MDWKLAYYFYTFLIGQGNKLPTYEFISKLIQQAENDTISMGYGIAVHKDLKIEYIEAINEEIIRVDVIKTDEYFAYGAANLNALGSHWGKTGFDDPAYFEEIDVEEFPRFKKKRVNILIDYLRKYKHEETIGLNLKKS